MVNWKTEKDFETLKTDPHNTLVNLTDEELLNLLDACNKNYYGGNPVVDNSLYDSILEYSEERGIDYKKVGYLPEVHKVKLPTFLGSMDKMKPGERKLELFFERFKGPYVLSHKLDGISCLIEYKKGEAPKLYTRGDGKVGQNICRFRRYINIPDINEDLLVRGELIYPKTYWKIISNKGENARNYMAGLVTTKTIKNGTLNDVKNIHFVAYEVIDEKLKSSEQFTILQKHKFNTCPFKVIECVDEEYLKKYMLNIRENSPYEIDGVIVTNDQVYKITEEKYRKHSKAFKMDLDDQMKETTVKFVQWKISKLGKCIPVVHIKPVEIESNEGSKSTIKKCSGHNAKYIINNGIGEGAKIIIIKSNDVIPKIHSVIEQGKVNYPEFEYEWNETKVHFISKAETKEQKIKKIISFFETIYTDNFGPGVVKQAYEQGLNTIVKILQAKKEDFCKLENFQETKAEKVYNSIQKAYNEAKLYQIMAGSNIFPNLGRKNAKLLCDNLNPLGELNIDKIITIKGFGKISSQVIMDNIDEFKTFFKTLPSRQSIQKVLTPVKPVKDIIKENSSIELTKDLKENTIEKESPTEPKEDIIKEGTSTEPKEDIIKEGTSTEPKEDIIKEGVSKELTEDNKEDVPKTKSVKDFHVAMSGTRDKSLIKWVEENGGTVHSTVTKKVKYLIVKNKKYRVTKKTKDAISKGVEIIQIDEFKEKFVN